MTVACERLFLGACFQVDGLALTSPVQPADMQHPGHGELLAVLVELAEQGKPTTEEMVMQAIEGRRDEPGLLSLIPQCWCSNPEDSEHWAREIVEASTKRVMAVKMAEAGQRAAEGEDVTQLIAEIQREADERLSRSRPAEYIAGDRIIGRAVHRLTAAREAREHGKTPGSYIPLGIEALDVLVGGAPRGTPTILAARPGVGKTTFLLHALTSMAKRGVRVLYLSNEDTDTPLGTSFLASESGVNRWDIFQGKIDDATAQDIELAAYHACKGWAQNWKALYVHGMKMRDIVSKARTIVKRHGIECIGLDYIQNVPSPDSQTPRHYAIEQNLSDFETLLAQEKVAGLLGCQLRRAQGDENHEPTMRDLKDSGSLEQKAKLIIALHDDETHKKRNTVRAIILKNSQGITGSETIRFNRSLARF